MGKSVKAFIFLLFTCIALFGATNYTKQLHIYDAQIENVSNDELLKVFHGLKNIYIHAIISSDEALKKETLQRLIKSAKILKIDSSKYESELSLMGKSTKKEMPEPEKVVIPVKENISPSPSLIKKTHNGKNLLQKVTTLENEVVLEFGETVLDTSIKVFTLRSPESYKKVIDIPAVILTSPKIITPKKLTNLRVSQYSGDFIRIVLDAPKEFSTSLSVQGNEVKILVGSKQEEIPKSSVKAREELPSAVALRKPIKRNKTIVIDPGHGGKDPGAIGYDKKIEKHLVLDVALALGKTLSSRGYKVVYTRSKDIFLNLRDRTKIANDNNADLFISLHVNAAPTDAKKLTMRGIETFFLSPDRSERSKNVAALENQSDMEEMDFYSKETFLNVFNREKIVLSNKASIDIHSGMLNGIKKRYHVEDGGVREAPFWVLVGATMPSVLVELGYISHPEESAFLFNPQYQKLLVEGMSDGIDKYFINNP